MYSHSRREDVLSGAAALIAYVWEVTISAFLNDFYGLSALLKSL
jgi:hypothetical protein